MVLFSWTVIAQALMIKLIKANRSKVNTYG